jgi:hypothetical protein
MEAATGGSISILGKKFSIRICAMRDVNDRIIEKIHIRFEGT